MSYMKYLKLVKTGAKMHKFNLHSASKLDLTSC